MRTTSDQSERLLSRDVAQPRVRGSMSPTAEAPAVFESIALGLLLNPRAVLYFAFLAKNGLRKAVGDELVAISDVEEAIADLSNPSYAIQDASTLREARNALAQLEQLDAVSTQSVPYKRFDGSISKILTTQVAQAVVSNSDRLIRTGEEADLELQTIINGLTVTHADVLDRLYALMVGVDNFLATPLATVIGLTTVSRVRSDFDEMIATIEQQGSLAVDRDLAIRIITNRAAIAATGSPPEMSAPLLSTEDKLPAGYEVSGRSDGATPSVASSVGPFTLPAAATFAVTVNQTTLGPYAFPQTTVDLANKAAVVSTAATYPITVPTNYYLFVGINGVSYKFGPLTTGSRTLAALLTEFNILFAAASNTVPHTLHAVEFVKAGTSRILIYHDTATVVSIPPIHISTGTDASPVGSVFTNSVASLIGFDGSETGFNLQTPAPLLVDSLNVLFGALVTSSLQNDGSILIESLTTDPGTTLHVTAPAVLHIGGVFTGSTTGVALFGKINGTDTDPVNPIGIIDVGDKVTTPTGVSTVASLRSGSFTLVDALPTFTGSIKVESTVSLVYDAFEKALFGFSQTWLASKFTKNLKELSLLINSVRAGNTQTQINAVTEFLSSLKALLNQLATLLDDSTYSLPVGSASREKAIVDSITSILTERKYDRALSLFLRCKIYEALNSTADTASFAGSFMNAASKFASTDMTVPNRALDEGVEGTSSQPIKGI